MKKINLAISGCMGRMGQQLIESSKNNNNFKLSALTENKLVKKKIYGIKPELNSKNAFKKADVIIDFTTPECTLEILKIAAKLKKRVLIGTTGFNQNQEKIATEIDNFNQAIYEICVSNDIKFVDVTPISRQVLEHPEWIAEDGLHPSGEQYKEWVKEILPLFLNFN